MTKNKLSTTAKAASKLIREATSVEFSNEHGEKFKLYKAGATVWMEGDEVSAMVDPKRTVDGLIPLFGQDFSVWANEELVLLGKALQELGEKK